MRKEKGFATRILVLFAPLITNASPQFSFNGLLVPEADFTSACSPGVGVAYTGDI